jgi:hypothetical protein
MKKPINITGLLLILILITGVIFKRLHLPGASIFLVAGIVFFILIYVPFYISWIYQAAKKTERSSNRFIAILTIVGVILLCLGSLFKIMHWPGANISVWFGLAVICIGLAIFLIQNRKVFFESLSMISVVLAILILGAFSFNFTSFKQYRGLWHAEKLVNPVFSESSNQIKQYCLEKVRENKEVLQVDSAQYADLLIIQAMVIKIDEDLDNKIKEIKNYLEEAEMTGVSWDEWMSNINYMLFSENFIEYLDEDLENFGELLHEFQVAHGESDMKLEKYFISDPDYIREDLKSKYFASIAIYENAYITSLEIWRNRIWRVFYDISKKSLRENIS